MLVGERRDYDEEWERHLDRVCARFPTTISPEGARRLARLLGVPDEEKRAAA